MSNNDWRARFEAPTLASFAIARDHTDRGVVISDLHGRYQAYAWERSTGELSQITDSDTAVLSATISPDGEWIFTPVEQDSGTEVGHIHRFPFSGGEPEDLTPGLDPYPVFDLEPTQDGVIALGATAKGPSLIIVGGGDPRVLQLETLPIALSLSGSVAGLTLTTPGAGLTPRALFIDLETGNVLSEHRGMWVGAMRESASAVAVVDGDWMRPALHSDGMIRPIEIDAPGDVVPASWSEDGSKILMVQTYRARSGIYLYDLGSESAIEMVAPDGALYGSRAELIDNSTALGIWSDARHPRRIVEVTERSWEVALEVGKGKSFPGPEWEEFNFESSDDAVIQGWLLRPEGEGPWPTVVYTHGGPTSVALPGFDPICGAWFDSGFAVASVNYRGSTTFGTAYREALTGRIGGPDVDDVVAARRWLVEQGIADPGRVVKNGYSYGGYLTLQALGTHPDLWAAGVAGAPIADWIEGYEEMNDVLKAYDMSIWGSRPDERREAAMKASPRTYAAEYQAPILITQPESDSRTPSAPVRLFVEDLEAHGKRVELILLFGGHAGAGKQQTISMVESWLDFATEELGMS